MLPGGGVLTTLIALALVPGFLFLRLSEGTRIPRAQSAFSELLEVLAVGLATTGSALFIWTLLKPDLVLRAREAPATPDALQDEAWLAFFMLATAVGLSLLLAGTARRIQGERYGLSVWKKSLGRRPPPGFMPHAILEMLDGSTVDGVLHAYTVAPDMTHRDISLRAPIGYTWLGRRTETPLALLNVSEERFRHVAIEYKRDPAIPLAPESDCDSVREFTLRRLRVTWLSKLSRVSDTSTEQEDQNQA